MARDGDYDDDDEDYDDDDGEDRPRRRRRRPRAEDYEMDHRGGMILTFGILSLVFSLLSFCFVFTVIVGLPLGILAIIWGNKDQNRIEEGIMNPEGRGMTQAGWICGIIGTIINLLFVLFIAVYAVFIFVIAVAGK